MPLCCTLLVALIWRCPQIILKESYMLADSLHQGQLTSVFKVQRTDGPHLCEFTIQSIIRLALCQSKHIAALLGHGCCKAASVVWVHDIGPAHLDVCHNEWHVQQLSVRHLLTAAQSTPTVHNVCHTSRSQAHGLWPRVLWHAAIGKESHKAAVTKSKTVPKTVSNKALAHGLHAQLRPAWPGHHALRTVIARAQQTSSSPHLSKDQCIRLRL